MRTQQEFDATEHAWRDRLAGLTLVVEANVDPDQAAQAFEILGANFKRLQSKNQRKSLLRQYRAALAVGLCNAGAREYDEGIFWPSVGRAFGANLGQSEQQEISEAFRAALESFELARFTTPQRNIGEILMHAGVPIASVESFVRTLNRRDELTENLDGRQFVSWVRSLTRELATSGGLDIPTWRFLTEGGEVSEDFVDRCLALLDSTAPGASAGEVEDGLPAEVVREVKRLVESGALLKPSGTARKRRRDEALYPRIVFDVANGIQIKLPPLETVTETAISWEIRAEGRLSRVQVAAPWPGDPVQARYESVTSPAKVVAVSVAPSEQTWNLELVDVDDPLLVFDAETGDWIPARNSLPKNSVWLAYANKGGRAFEECIESYGQVRLLGVSDSPYGWDGWSFAEVDPSNAVKLKLLSSDRWRYVTFVSKPMLSNLEYIRHSTTLDGRHITSTRPKVVLPAAATSEGGSSTSIAWTVSIEDRADNSTLSFGTFESQPEPTAVDPWPRNINCIVGDFNLVVRGPLGRGLTTRVAIAEGYAFSADAEFRSMNHLGTGLDPAEVKLMAPAEIASQSKMTTLNHSDRSARLDLAALQGDLTVIVAVPHMSVSVQGQHAPGVNINPLRIDLEDLADVVLRVVTPMTGRVEMVALSGGEVVQTVFAGDGQQGSRLFNLAQLADSLARTGGGALSVGSEGIRVPIASISPRKLADGVAVSPDGLLRLSGFVPTRNLTCALYPTFAPWRLPIVVDIDEVAGCAQLDASVLREGAVKAHLRVEDPWNPQPWAELPDLRAANLFDLEVGELFDEPGLPDSGFRTWLARTDDCPRTPESVATALTIFSLLRKFSPKVARKTLRHELALAVRSNRELVVQSVLETEASARDLMRFFVESDVVTVPGEAWESTPVLWTYSVALGILADSDLWVTDDKPLLANDLATYAGTSAIQILKEGRDPHASIGRFDDTVALMNVWPQERVDAIWDVANPLPGRFLDEDPRASSGKALFDQRHEREVRELSMFTSKFLAQAKSILATEVGPEAIAPVEARLASDGWRNLPALSLAFALCARLAARGSDSANDFFVSTRSYYANLAHAAPSIVERDLGLAELWVTYWSEQ